MPKRIVSLFRNLFRKEIAELDLDEELHATVEFLVQEKLLQGLTPREARRQALVDLGGVEQVKERVREARMGTMVDSLWQDFRYGLRTLGKHRGFTIIAVLTLALGISANTTIFSMISAFFFRPLPVKDPEQLVLILQKSANWKLPHGHSYPDYLDYRDRVDSFSDLIAFMLAPVHLSAPGQQPQRTWIEVVSGNYFSFLGVEAAYGRVFLPEEGRRVGADPVVVLSHHYWQRQFGGDPSVVGQRIILNSHPFTVIGISPAEFTSAEWSIAVAAFVPSTMFGQIREGGENVLKSRSAAAFKVMGRLKTGINLTQARASVDVVAAQLARDFPDEHKEATVTVVREMNSRPEPTFSEFMPLIAAVFIAMVGLVLFIACANVANLMFSRALVRRKEMGIRVALGAGRWRLIRQLLAESVLLGIASGVFGMIFASATGAMLSNFVPVSDIPVLPDESWDWRVFVFTFFMSALAGIATGLAPALRATKLDIQTTLKESGSTWLTSGRHLFRSTLVVSQVAISLVVLICGGLFMHTLRSMTALDLGFRTTNLLMASLDLDLQGYDQDRAEVFYRQLLDRAEALQGVRAATVSSSVPFDNNFRTKQVGAEGHTGDGLDGFMIAGYNAVGDGYLQTLGIAILRGRDFTRQDKETGRKVAIINTVFAERFWPGENPLGKRFRFGQNGELIEVVGIARNGKYIMIGEEPRSYFYLPLAQHYTSPVTVHLRTTGDPENMVPDLRKVLAGLDPHLPIYNIRTLDSHLRNSVFALMPLRIGATLAGVQGLLGLLLAVMGIYGVVSYAVSLRTREIGIRMALGAQRFHISRIVIREGWNLILTGIGIGLLIAFILTRILSRLLYGVNPTSVPVFIGAVILIAAVALLACYRPARRATKVDPMAVLRWE